MLKHMLDLSTAHMPCTKPDFGKARHQENEYGFVVWVGDIVDEAPDWLEPIMRNARGNNCILINFDRDADTDDEFKTYEW